MIEVLNQTEFGTSSETEVYTKHGFLSNLEVFLKQLATLYYPLQNDADGDFVTVLNDTSLVN